MDNIKQAKKLLTLQSEPNMALFDEIQAVNEKLKSIGLSLKSINSKETTTYEKELQILCDGLSELKSTLEGKDMVVNMNVPLDKLEASIKSVEAAVKSIKIDIPKQIDTLKLNDEQINALLLEIQAIPPFPIEELDRMFKSLSDKLTELKPTEDSYDFTKLEKKLSEVIGAVRSSSIAMAGGGGGLGTDSYNKGIDNLINNQNNYAGEKTPLFDKSVIVWDSNGNPTTITYSLDGVTVATKTFTWDSDGNPTDIVITY